MFWKNLGSFETKVIKSEWGATLNIADRPFQACHSNRIAMGRFQHDYSQVEHASVDLEGVVHDKIPGNRSNSSPTQEAFMKYGARNNIQAKVTSIKKGDVMSLVKFEVVLPAAMASVLTTESVEDLDLKVGDEVSLVIKAIHVLPVKEA